MDMALLSSLTSGQFRDWLIYFAGLAGLAWYYICLCDLGFHPTAANTQATGFRQFQSLSLTTISVSLATYVGFVVGLPTSENAATTAAKIGDVAAQASSGSASAASAAAAAVSSVIPTIGPLQVVSAVVYLVSLLLAVFFYWRSKDATEPAVAGLAKSLLGFVAGVFSISLKTGA